MGMTGSEYERSRGIRSHLPPEVIDAMYASRRCDWREDFDGLFYWVIATLGIMLLLARAEIHMLSGCL